jgi:hypothetical protein
MKDDGFTETLRSARHTITSCTFNDETSFETMRGRTVSESSGIGSVASFASNDTKMRGSGYFGYPDTKSLNDAAKAFLEGGLGSL